MGLKCGSGTDMGFRIRSASVPFRIRLRILT
jgi:hypothetical protein